MYRDNDTQNAIQKQRHLLILSVFSLGFKTCSTTPSPDGSADFISIDGVKDLRFCGASCTSVNEGAGRLRAELDSTVERAGGYAECWDDVTGTPLGV